MGGRGGGSGRGGGGGGGGLSKAEQSYLNTRGQLNHIPGTDQYVAEWFADKEGIHSIVGLTGKESEKAIQIEVADAATYRTGVKEFDHYTRTTWVPKSVLQTPKQFAEKGTKGRVNNKRYNDYLRQTAADNNIKIGNLSSWSKITEKLKKKGVSVKSRKEFGV